MPAETLTSQPTKRSTFHCIYRYRNYRLFFFGMLVSVAGTWMQSTAQTWLVYKVLNAGPSAVGIMLGVSFGPAIFLGAWFGVLVDRFDRRKLVAITQSVMAVSAFVLAVLTITGNVELWMVYACAAVTGTFNTLDNPSRSSLTMEIVEPADITNAVGLTTMMFQMGRVVGPAMAGFLIQAGLGVGWCFLMNAASYIAVLASLAMMNRSELRITPPVPKAPGQVREGARYVWREPTIRRLILAMTALSALVMNQQVIFPVLADETFNGDSGLFGLFGTVQGAGAVVAGVWTARRKLASPQFTTFAVLGLGAASAAAALAPTKGVELVVLFAYGVALFTVFGCITPTLNLRSDPDKRGRVMALHSLAMFGSTAIGAPLIGFLVRAHGPRTALWFGAVSAAVIAALMHLDGRREARAQQSAAEATEAGEPDPALLIGSGATSGLRR